MLIRPRSPTPPLNGNGEDEEDDFANLSREEIERLARERFQEQRVSSTSRVRS